MFHRQREEVRSVEGNVSDAGLGVVHEEVGDGPVEDEFSRMVQRNLVAEIGRKAAVGFMHSCNLRWHTW